MERQLSRRELLVEFSVACAALREVGNQGDAMRFDNDRVFRFAIAFLWLRAAEPACQLRKRRLVDEVTRDSWSALCIVRNTLAHGRGEDIGFGALWRELSGGLISMEAQAAKLLGDDSPG